MMPIYKVRLVQEVRESRIIEVEASSLEEALAMDAERFAYKMVPADDFDEVYVRYLEEVE